MLVGSSYRSFRGTKNLPLKELQSTLIEAVHEPTGARIMHIANNDPENLFCLSFQTLPSSSNGVAHILEHIVLCGSKKFPIKDPFFSMTRRSLNTYMNALTGQDFTCYPASSQVEKDFYNLLEVYIDAVFHPELKLMSFLQEGHRLVFTEQKTLEFQGVVYNEMKGSLSSAEPRLWEVVLKHLTPDLPYAVNSGGNPKVIPSLTYEELKSFHRKYYHPSRCIFFFYGNLPLEKHLDFLLENALSDVKKEAPLPLIPLQKRFLKPVTIQASYPIAESEPTLKKTWIVFSFLTAPLLNQEEVLALCLIDSLLMDTDASPLKIAILKSGLCTSADSSVDVEMSEIPFSFIFKGCVEKNAPDLKKLLFDTLKTCHFSEEEIDASLHQLEFDRTEIGAEGVPFGLSLFFRSALNKQHGSEPENALLIHTLFRSLRKDLKDPQFLQNLIRKYFLDNQHFVKVIFSPDAKLSAQERNEEEATLRKLLHEVDEKKIIAETKELAKYQESIETQSLDCLPKLNLKDIPRKVKDYPLFETKMDQLHVFHHPCFTNQILYADLIFDLPAIAEKDLPLVSLFVHFLTELGCGGRDYAENLSFQQAYTGGVQASLAMHTPRETPDLFYPYFSLRGKVLARNSEKLFSLFADFMQGVDCTDRERIQELLEQQATELQNRLTKNALNYAIQTSLLDFSKIAFVSDQWYGLSYYQAVLEWLKKPEKIPEELHRIQNLILGKGIPHLVISSEKETFDEIQNQSFFNLHKKLETRELIPWKSDFSVKKQRSQARFISSPVAFTARGQRTICYKDPRSSFLVLASELLDNTHLHKEIREKGGAYGSGANYSPHTGNFHFYSYRDPNLAKTIGEFQIALEKISKGNFSNQDLEEAKFGAIQSLDAPVPPGNRAKTAYAWYRSGRTLEERQKFREAVLSATKEDVANAVRELLLPSPHVIVSFLGEDLYRREEKKLHDPLDILTIH
ncbi:MAG TPA: insulinase family protein [Chlamydiales bacterium]|nr:insulinase family protein [Chlamydiales bacterium]